MININTHIKYTIIAYIIISIYIWELKPKIMFEQINKKMKPFGLGPNKTIFYYPIIIIVIGIIIYSILINYF